MMTEQYAQASKALAVKRVDQLLNEACTGGWDTHDIAQVLVEIWVGPAPGQEPVDPQEFADLLEEALYSPLKGDAA